MESLEYICHFIRHETIKESNETIGKKYPLRDFFQQGLPLYLFVLNFQKYHQHQDVIYTWILNRYQKTEFKKMFETTYQVDPQIRKYTLLYQLISFLVVMSPKYKNQIKVKLILMENQKDVKEAFEFTKKKIEEVETHFLLKKSRRILDSSPDPHISLLSTSSLPMTDQQQKKTAVVHQLLHLSNTGGRAFNDPRIAKQFLDLLNELN